MDAQIRNLGDTDLLGEHTYNRDGTSQSRAQYAGIGTPAKYEVQVRNTSPSGANETLTVHGPASDTHWGIAYFEEDHNDITNGVVIRRGGGTRRRGSRTLRERAIGRYLLRPQHHV